MGQRDLPAEAVPARVGSVVDIRAGNGVLDATNFNREVGQSSRAREDIASCAGVVLRVLDLLVVIGDRRSREVDEGGASISDSVDAAGVGGRADLISRGSELPEAVCSADGDVGEGARVLR